MIMVLNVAAGKTEKAPPKTGPPTLAIKTAKAIIKPLKKPLKNKIGSVYLIFCPAVDLVCKICSTKK